MGFAPTDMQVSSESFANQSAIPRQYSGEAEDLSPQLSWINAPANTKGFAVICHDPDAPLASPNGTYGFVHWVLYNIPGSVHSLDEGQEPFTKGMNNFGKLGYGGPMPPEGHGTHHYYFWVLALDCETNLPEGLSMWELIEKLEPNIIGMNRLIGSYVRP